MKYLVTGGAGFIGSHIVDKLISQKQQVIVYDNLSTGSELFINHHVGNPNFRLIKDELLDEALLVKTMKSIDFVFHLAAHADVRSGYTNYYIDHNQNLEVTRAVLEAMRKQNVKNIAFASTSSVYGDAKTHPTPEDYPFAPTSLYGATKAACETYIQAYASYFDWKAYIFRFVSFIGERYSHGIIFDLMKKIKIEPKKLELLSDGTPKKSSLYVTDGIEAIFTIIQKAKERVNIYNIGHDEILTVDETVEIILSYLNCNPKKYYLGGKKGWPGDNNYVHLDTTRLKAFGWKPKTGTKEAIGKTIDYLLSQPGILAEK